LKSNSTTATKRSSKRSVGEFFNALLAIVMDRARMCRPGVKEVLERPEVRRSAPSHHFRSWDRHLLLRKPAQLAVHEPGERTNKRCEYACFRNRHVF
jgi:hypothetical protein